MYHVNAGDLPGNEVSRRAEAVLPGWPGAACVAVVSH